MKAIVLSFMLLLAACADNTHGAGVNTACSDGTTRQSDQPCN